MRPSRRHLARRRGRGFTLVELLIAGLMSALVLLSVYFVFIANTAQYYRQEQIVQMQESMRFAVELLKNDLRNAGRLAIVRGEGPRDPDLCLDRPGVRAVELFERELEPQKPILAANGLAPDRLRLIVDAGSAVMLRTRLVSPDRVVLAPAAEQPTAEARAIAGSEARFERQFRPGMYLSISSPENLFDMVPITDVAFAQAGSSFNLGQNLCPRFDGCGSSCLVGVTQLVEYAVEVHPDDATRTDLIRRVIDTRNGETSINGLSLTVAEYVVNLQVWGLDRAAAATSMVDEREVDPPREDEAGRATLDNIRTVRGLGVLLAARTPREDAEYVVSPDRAVAPGERRAADRGWFEINDTPGTGLARVATLKAQVEATNLYRGEVDAID